LGAAARLLLGLLQLGILMLGMQLQTGHLQLSWTKAHPG
jgi:hypothetical protein